MRNYVIRGYGPSDIQQDVSTCVPNAGFLTRDINDTKFDPYSPVCLLLRNVFSESCIQCHDVTDFSSH